MHETEERYINYFVVDNKEYYTGTVFIMKCSNGEYTKATFICYDTQNKMYCYQPHNSKCNKHWANYEVMQQQFIDITNEIDNKARIPVKKQMNDRCIESLPLGWCWYIFLMLLSIVFKDCLGLWVLISIVFFSWRNKKIKTEGTYYEW